MRVHAAFLIACATATMLSLLPPHFPSFVSNFEMCRRGRNFKPVLVSAYTHKQHFWHDCLRRLGKIENLVF